MIELQEQAFRLGGRNKRKMENAKQRGEMKMSASCRGRRIGPGVAWTILALAASLASATDVRSCQKVAITGEVNAGHEWKAVFGEGWVFRVLPIDSGKTGPGKTGYSGWDLVVDREQPAGFPDALLLATPPYNSINEREVGTTFGLRAQDAIGWNPRSFRFLTNLTAFRESQKLFQSLSRDGQLRLVGPELYNRNTPEAQATRRLMELQRQSSAGEFHILDAHLAPGISDAASYAENWALASQKTPQTFEPATGPKSTPLGELHWMRFSVTLWLPGAWQTPKELHATRAACPE